MGLLRWIAVGPCDTRRTQSTVWIPSCVALNAVTASVKVPISAERQSQNVGDVGRKGVKPAERRPRCREEALFILERLSERSAGMAFIEVYCPHGHRLKVREEYSGRTGACPVCGAKVKVPEKKQSLSEDEILKLLGEAPPPRPENPVAESGPEGPSPPAPARLPKKICEKCHREIIAATRICPYCHTYLGFKDLTV